MAKKVRERALDTRAAGDKLKVAGKPYYRSIGHDLHLGYRKGKDARRWVVRRYAGAGNYVVETIGHADDISDADGTNVLTFWQAQTKAHAMQGASTPGAYTLKQAIADYLVHMEGRSTRQQIFGRLAKYVPAALANKPLAEVGRADIAAWHAGMAASAPMVRTSKGAAPNRRNVDLGDAEVIRRRQVSANRVLTQLRAAMNFAFAEGKVSNVVAGEWRRVKPFHGVTTARVRHLTVAECVRLLNACEGDLRSLVRAALETGCRYQECARLVVEDFHQDSGTLLIRQSKSGRSRHVILTEQGTEFFGGLAAGRKNSDLLLGRPWPESACQRPLAAACKRAGIDPAISIHTLRHTWASLAVMAGVPLIVVARNLGHSDTRMVEKHYGHLAQSYVTDAIRRGAPRFGVASSNVKDIR